MNDSRIASHAPAVFDSVWDWFGSEGLAWLLLSGVQLESVWLSLAQEGHITPEAISLSSRVTTQTELIGLYGDLGREGGDPDQPYLGSSFASTWKTVPGHGARLRGIAWRVIGEHEREVMRLSNPAEHYKRGYAVSSRRSDSTPLTEGSWPTPVLRSLGSPARRLRSVPRAPGSHQ